ncbi:MAG TPA: hypothetical protein VGC76_02575 [Pyrinomonadaceae bacterium]|jgi:hypothetical protein
MRPFRLAFLLFWLLIVSVFAFPQTSPTESQTDKEKAAQELEKDALKLAQQSATEATSLKLWQNRALIYALAGDLFWKTDQKKARSLFRDAANELVLGIQIPKEKQKNYFEDYSWWQDSSPRRSVLLMVAAYDADLALDMLLETRPPDLQTAIDAYNQPPATTQNKTQVQSITEQKNKFKAQQEIQLEQQFAVKAAEQDPKKAAKLIRDSLAKGFSQSIADLLEKINEKNEELGKELLAEILQKLVDADFKQKEDAMSLTSYLLLQSFSPDMMKARNPKFTPLKIEDRDLKQLAAKTVDYYLAQTNFDKLWNLTQIIQVTEKYAPEKAALLKQKEAELKKVMPEYMRSWQEAGKLISDPNTTPEKLIEEAEKYTGYEKYQMYQTAVDRAINAGTSDKIRQALQNLPDNKQRNDALDYLDSKISDKAIKDDKLDDVQKIVAKSTSDSAKIKLLVNLAVGYQKKNTEDSHKTAISLMSDARKLVGDIPESREEVGDIMKIAAGYAEIDPDKAFPLLTSLTDMTNDMLTAYALLSKYNKSENMFKQGEMIFTQSLGYGGTFMQYGKELKLLAAADFGKTSGMIDQIRRDDLKTLMRILLAQSIIKEKLSVEGNQIFYSYEEY